MANNLAYGSILIDNVLFHLLQTESNPRCSYDRVRILDTNGSLLHSYCGKNTQNLHVSYP